MALYPGRIYVNDTQRLAINWQNTDGTDLDPTTDVILKTYSPSGNVTTYSYVAAEVDKESTGDYYVEVTPDESGRWRYRWQATGSGTKKAIEGSFIVQSSVFYDDPPTDYGR